MKTEINFDKGLRAILNALLKAGKIFETTESLEPQILMNEVSRSLTGWSSLAEEDEPD